MPFLPIPSTIKIILPSSADVLTNLDGYRTIKGEKTQLYFGVELEVEVLNKNGKIGDRFPIAKKILDLFDKTAILKEEGSVWNGFEIVTIPASLNFHKEHLWNAFFKSRNSRLVSARPDSCGMHIHFSKGALTDVQLAKVIFFIHEDFNKTFLTYIAGRYVGENASYCKQIKKTYVAGNATPTLYEARENKFQAINISSRNRGRTCEVRIFKGTTRPSMIYKNLEFVDALIAYCAISPNNENSLTYVKFCEWFVEKNMQLKYPYLNRFLLRKKYVKGKHMTLKEIANYLMRNVKVG